MSDYLDQRRQQKITGIVPDRKKEKKPIKKVSDKRAAKLAAEKEARGGDDTLKQKWFNARRKEMTGICACGCMRGTSKKDNEHFRNSCCHIFPQHLFPSVIYHPKNFVERNFWLGCHTNMDNQSMDNWIEFADWEDIKEKFHILAPLLTDEERATKFYAHLEKLIYQN